LLIADYIADLAENTSPGSAQVANKFRENTGAKSEHAILIRSLARAPIVRSKLPMPVGNLTTQSRRFLPSFLARTAKNVSSPSAKTGLFGTQLTWPKPGSNR